MPEKLEFETLIARIKENRAKLSVSDSFKEIGELWEKIKKDHTECAKILSEITEQIKNIEKNEKTEAAKNVDFDKAMKRMEALCQEVKTVSINKIAGLITEMQQLKGFCLQQLETEKVKMETVE